jgi:hypothetical protein
VWPACIPGVIVVRSPPNLSRRDNVVRDLEAAYERGQIVAVTGHGPIAFARGYQALVRVARRHTLALHDPTGVTAEWERITKQTEPRSASRSAAAEVPWVLHAMAPPFSIPLPNGIGSDGERMPDRIAVTDGETILRSENHLTYVIGPMVIVAEDEELEPALRHGNPAAPVTPSTSR